MAFLKQVQQAAIAFATRLGGDLIDTDVTATAADTVGEEQ